MNFFDYIAMPFGYLMQFCCMISPGQNYLIALIYFTVIIQIILCLIFGIKQQKNMIKQASIAPMAAALRKKYAGRDDAVTRQKLQQETMELYQKHGYSPLGGCFPMLIQLPIIMALYNVIVAPLQNMFMLTQAKIDVLLSTLAREHTHLLSQAALDQLAHNQSRLAQVEALKLVKDGSLDGLLSGEAGDIVEQLASRANALPSYSSFGLDFSTNPEAGLSADSIAKFWPLLIVPVLIIATMIASQKLSRKFSYQDPTITQQQGGCSMNVMMYSMPVLSAWISLRMPAAVGVYWIYRSVTSTLQQFILSKVMPLPKFTEEDYKKAEKEMNGTSKRKKNSEKVPYTGEKKRSLHHIDDDDDDTVLPPKKETAPALESSVKEEEKEEKNENVDPSKAPVMKEDKGNKKYQKK